VGDSLVGRAARYDLRYSTSPLTPQNFALANSVAGLPTPADAGTRQSVVVTGLRAGSLYYFAIKSVDAAGNWSVMSNVVLRAAQESASDVEGLTTFFSPPSPNPARDVTQFSLTLPEAVQVAVEVFDVAGRRVNVLADGPRSAGTASLTFDLRDERGTRLAEGLYLVRAKLGDLVYTRRLVVTR
jgi:hypothetical protein